MITYRTTPDEWSPGYLAAYIYDDGRFAVVIDGRPVFSGTGYVPGMFHDERQQVADILDFAACRIEGRDDHANHPLADDLRSMSHDIEGILG